MFNKVSCQTNLSGLVGFRQPIDPTFTFTLSPANLLASSGRYFDENTFINLKLLRDCQDYKDITQSQFQTLLTNIQNSAISNVLDECFVGSDYIDRQLLYINENNKTEVDSLPAGFVGYEIEQDKTKNLAFEISRCILEFEGTGDITLFLFNSQKKTYVYTQTVAVTSTLQEVILNWKAENISPLYKGKYIFGYYTHATTLQPVKREYEKANVQQKIKHLRIENVKYPFAYVNANLWDLELKEGASECWGLNPDITVYYDYTDLIIQNKSLFASAIQLSGQIKIIEQYISTFRSNINERLTGDMINKLLVEIEGAETDSIRKRGLKQILVSEITRIKDYIQKLKDGYFSNYITVVRRS